MLLFWFGYFWVRVDYKRYTPEGTEIESKGEDGKILGRFIFQIMYHLEKIHRSSLVF